MWIVDSVKDLFAHNQFLAGGALLGTIGALVALLRTLPGRLWAHFLARYTTVVDVPSSDPLYRWVQQWLADQPCARSTGLLSAASEIRTDPATVFNCARPGAVTARPVIVLTPAPGYHWAWYGGRPLSVHRERKERQAKDGYPDFTETVTLRFYTRDRAVPRTMLDEARDLALPPGDGGVHVFAPAYDNWGALGTVAGRDPGSLVLPDGLVDDLFADVERFVNDRPWYEARGVPYHRGYLFEGPPGNGKTSLLRALGQRFGFSLYTMNLSGEAFGSAHLSKILAAVPRGALLVLEDVDRDPAVVAAGDIARTTVDRKGINLTNVLNALDGLTTPQGQIVVMTANNPDKIDPAVLRPGRVDRVFTFTNSTPAMAARLYLNFFPGNDAFAERFGDSAAGFYPMPSMATLQGHLLRHRDDPHAAADFDQPPAVALALEGEEDAA